MLVNLQQKKHDHMRITIRLAGVLTLFICGCSDTSESTYTQLAQENARLQAQLDSLALHIDSLAGGQNPTQASGNRTGLLSQQDIAYLKRMGLTNPAEEIKADLIKNRQLIPAAGSLGGTMQFYKEQIHLLNRQWVMAYFEDGHNAGEMLLEYKIGERGNISWKVLSSRMI
jgi:hypothetical protein